MGTTSNDYEEITTCQLENKEYDQSEDKRTSGLFRHIFSFRGRICRSEFGISFIIYFVWHMLLRAIDVNFMTYGETLFFLFSSIVVIWFYWAQCVKRCHDLGHSGFFIFVPFYVFWMLFDEGDGTSENEYGPAVK